MITLNIPCFSVSIVNFEQVNAGWGTLYGVECYYSECPPTRNSAPIPSSTQNSTIGAMLSDHLKQKSQKKFEHLQAAIHHGPAISRKGIAISTIS